MAISLQPNVWHVKDSEGNYLSSAILSTTLPQEADALLTRIRTALSQEEIDATTFKNGFSDDLDNLIDSARDTLDDMLEEEEQLVADIRSTAQAKTDAEAAAAAAAQSATNASGSASAAAGSASDASDSASAAGQSASAAAQSATNASNSATAASGSASAAAGSASDAADSAQEAQDILDSIPNDYSDLSDDVDQLKIDITGKSNALVKSATSGDIVTFESGAEGLGISKLVATIEPMQNLNGYDNPWPAGGGKNKFNYSGLETGGIDGTGQDDDTATTDSRTDFIAVTAEASYTISGLSASVTAFYYDSNGDFVSSATVGNETITIPSGVASLRLSGTTANFTSTTQLESGSTATSFAPYSNICPITGWTGCNISHSGVDTSNPDVLSISWQTEAGTVYGGTLTLNEDGSADLAVTLIGKKIKDVTWQYLDKNGMCFRTSDTYDYFNSQELTFNNCLCSAYKVRLIDASYIGDNEITFKSKDWNAQYPRIVVRDSRYKSVSQFVSAMGEEIIVYPRRISSITPYHFDNIGQLKTFLGTNNVWTNTGSITELTYYSDTQSTLDDIRSLITFIEPTSTASQNYAIGDVLLYNNKLYVTTSVITTGATLTPGTNIVETTVIARLIDLETRLKSGTIENADLHLGLYVDNDGDISQVDD